MSRRPAQAEVNLVKLHACEKCPLRAYAERKPTSLIARLWRWHTKWCPGWRAYQKSLAERPPGPPQDD